MAKKTSKGYVNQKADSRGDVSKNTANAEAGRTSKRNTHHMKEQRRSIERQEGTLYPRVNGGRSTNLLAAIRGEVGSYAYPGNENPSVHFNVQKEVGAQGSMSVIRLESIQHGHSISGKIFNPFIFLPCFYIEKFGTNFRSRLENRLGAKTQELICNYFASECDYTAMEEIESEVPSLGAEKMEESIDEKFARANLDMSQMLAGKPGLYGYKNGDGVVLLGVFIAKRTSIEVVESTVPGIEASPAYIPVHLLMQKTLDRPLTVSEETYSNQLTLYVFLRSELANFFGQPAANEKPLGAKEMKKIA
jgi:hypothetical protein